MKSRVVDNSTSKDQLRASAWIRALRLSISTCLMVPLCVLVVGTLSIAVGQDNLGTPTPASGPPASQPDRKQTGPSTELNSGSPNTVDPEAALIPDFFLASVSIDAVVVGERVNMEATIEVVINRDTGWQRIPLRFDQAHIWSREYSGPGDEAPDPAAGNGNEGISWMLKGKGKHLLKFSMWTPYRTSVIGSRLQLILPPLSSQFDTQMKLTVPEPNAILRASPNLAVQETIRDAEKTVFQTSVSQNRLDVVWTAPQSNARLVSKALTVFQLKPAVDSLYLIANQTIDLQQQDTKELVVKLPTEFALTSTEVNQSAIEEIADRPGWVKVKLNDASSGKVNLRWEFRKDLAKNGDRVVIDGLEIEGAVQEVGSIQIEDLRGFRTIPIPSDSRLVYRAGLNEMTSPGRESLNSLYEYLQQPFRLVKEIRPIESLYSTSLIHEIEISESKLSLKTHQLIEVERGTVQEFDLRWPQFDAEGWQFKGATSSDLTLGNVKTVTGMNGEALSSTVVEGLSGGERLHLISKFERSIASLENNELTWTLPTPPAENARGSMAILTLADQLEATFAEPSQIEDSSFQNDHQLQQLSEMWKLSKSLLSRLTDTDKIDLNVSANIPFKVALTQHDQSVSLNTTVEIQEVTPRDLLVYQQFDLNVKYGRIQTIELSIPDELKTFLEPAGVATGLTATFEGQSLSVSVIGGIPRVVLPEKLKGAVQFEIQYRLPVSEETKKNNVLIPVISLATCPISQLAVLITPIENVQLVNNDLEWVAAQTFSKGPLWIQDLEEKKITSFAVQVGEGVSETAQQYFVERANFWTNFEDDGRAKTLARFEILSPPSRLVMTFPPSAEFVATIDGESIPEEAILRSGEDSKQVVISLPDGIDDRRVLEVQYLTEGNSSFSFAEQQTFEFPQFAQSVWVNETIWEVQLPFGFHLSEYPGLKPLFSWTRNGVIWVREPNAVYTSERQAAFDKLPESFQFERNFYAFRGFSPVASVQFRSMNRSLILLIGAGFALALGFVFYRFPLTRNVFSLVVLAFIFAVASVWYLEPMLLLLQPAVVGILLALTATFIDLRTTNQTNIDRSSIQRTKSASSDSRSKASDLGDGTTRIYSPITSHGADSSPG